MLKTTTELLLKVLPNIVKQAIMLKPEEVKRIQENSDAFLLLRPTRYNLTDMRALISDGKLQGYIRFFPGSPVSKDDFVTHSEIYGITANDLKEWELRDPAWGRWPLFDYRVRDFVPLENSLDYNKVVNVKPNKITKAGDADDPSGFYTAEYFNGLKDLELIESQSKIYSKWLNRGARRNDESLINVNALLMLEFNKRKLEFKVDNQLSFLSQQLKNIVAGEDQSPVISLEQTPIAAVTKAEGNKKTMVINVEVTNRYNINDKPSGNNIGYRYLCVSRDKDGRAVPVGLTRIYKKKFEAGDILTVNISNLGVHTDVESGEIWHSWSEPHIIKHCEDKTEPDTIEKLMAESDRESTAGALPIEYKLLFERIKLKVMREVALMESRDAAYCKQPGF
jgi:hypothetical protein